MRTKLRNTADDLGAVGLDPLYGYGLVDADEAAGTSSPPANTTPIAHDDSASTDEDTSVVIDVLANDTDADVGDTLTVTNLSQPSNGTVNLNGNQTVTYIPDLNFYGDDSFTYTASDGKATSNVATVRITVASVNDGPPTADFIWEDSGLAVDFTDMSFDDGHLIAWSWNFGDYSSSTQQNPTHTYTAPGGTYTVTLTVTDNDGATDTWSTDVTVSEGSISGTMRVGSILMSLNVRSAGKKNVFVGGVAEVTIVNASGPVEGATVYGSWSGATSATVYGVTDSSGLVVFNSSEIKNPSTPITFIFTVDDVIKSGWEYDPSANLETSDSISVP